jgi:hypothetical protein
VYINSLNLELQVWSEAPEYIYFPLSLALVSNRMTKHSPNPSSSYMSTWDNYRCTELYLHY